MGIPTWESNTGKDDNQLISELRSKEGLKNLKDAQEQLAKYLYLKNIHIKIL